MNKRTPRLPYAGRPAHWLEPFAIGLKPDVKAHIRLLAMQAKAESVSELGQFMVDLALAQIHKRPRVWLQKQLRERRETAPGDPEETA